jgi:hypothetical protein
LDVWGGREVTVQRVLDGRLYSRQLGILHLNHPYRVRQIVNRNDVEVEVRHVPVAGGRQPPMLQFDGLTPAVDATQRESLARGLIQWDSAIPEPVVPARRPQTGPMRRYDDVVGDLHALV